MTSEELALMDYPLGMPLAWLFTPNDEVIVDDEGRPVARYIEEFEYTYDEESDDLCDITFKFDSVTKFDLPYFQNDVIFVVQWGFVTPTGDLIQSPKRKVAVRDIKTSYSEKGFTLTLSCSDLVAYLKAYKTNTIRNFSSSEAEGNIKTAAKTGNNFINWVKEIADGQFTATITTDKTAVNFTVNGDVTVADFDTKTNRQYNVVRDGTAIPQKFYHQFYAAKTIKGKSKSLDQAMRDQLRNVLTTAANYMIDGTGNHLDIRPRNFDQDIFKKFIWQGEPRNFIDFSNSSDTRKVEQDKISSTSVNPYTKEVDSAEISVKEEEKDPRNPFYIISEDANTEAAILAERKIAREKAWEDKYAKDYQDFEKKRTLLMDQKAGVFPRAFDTSFMDDDINTPSTDIKKVKETLEVKRNDVEFNEQLKLYADKAYETFEYNYLESPENQKELEPLYVTQPYVDKKGIVRRDAKIGIKATDIINLPAFQSLLESKATDVTKQAIKTAGLLGATVEKIQRKYEATATVMGDPSLTKGRTYAFFGLSKKDSGKWYCTSVSHSISRGKGYICNMSLLRKPRTISYSEINYRAKRNLLEKDEVLELNKYVSQESGSLYSGLQDEVYNEMKSEELNEIEDIQNRLQTLNAAEDQLKD